MGLNPPSPQSKAMGRGGAREVRGKADAALATAMPIYGSLLVEVPILPDRGGEKDSIEITVVK